MASLSKVLEQGRGSGARTLIECCNLRKAFGPSVALAGVSLRIAAAEVVAIVGPSGSGKSTLLHCLAGLERPDSGEVRALDEHLSILREPRLTQFRRGHFGFVFQFPSLIPELSALENVALVGWLVGMERNKARDSARDLLAQLGVASLANNLPGQLSGGEAQRVALARALINLPQIVFADEPTGALDSENAMKVGSLLVGLARERGCAVLLVTHDPLVAGVADRRLELLDGAVVAER